MPFNYFKPIYQKCHVYIMTQPEAIPTTHQSPKKLRTIFIFASSLSNSNFTLWQFAFCHIKFR